MSNIIQFPPSPSAIDTAKYFNNSKDWCEAVANAVRIKQLERKFGEFCKYGLQASKAGDHKASVNFYKAAHDMKQQLENL